MVWFWLMVIIMCWWVCIVCLRGVRWGRVVVVFCMGLVIKLNVLFVIDLFLGMVVLILLFNVLVVVVRVGLLFCLIVNSFICSVLSLVMDRFNGGRDIGVVIK